MSPAVPHRLFDRLALALVIIVIAVPLTWLEVVHPSRTSWRGDLQSLVARLPHTATAPAAKPATPAATKPAATTSTTTTTTPATATALTTSYVHLRAAKSVTSTIITDLNAGTTVQLGSDADATWQSVTYQGKSGYIYRAYLQYPATTPAP